MECLVVSCMGGWHKQGSTGGAGWLGRQYGLVGVWCLYWTNIAFDNIVKLLHYMIILPYTIQFKIWQ